MEKLSVLQWRTLVLCTLVAVIDGFDVSAMAVATPAVAHAWRAPLSLFGPALSASLLGLALGGAAGGPLGDRYGRRRILLVLFLIGLIATTFTGLAPQITPLTVGRFFTGLALGGTIPLGAAITAEFMPASRRRFLLVVMFTGHPLGGALAGIAAPSLIDAWGWPAVFFTGGLLPALLFFGLLAWLPESRECADQRKAAPLSSQSPKDSVQELLGPGRLSATLILWALFFATQFQLFFLASWLPSLLTQMGQSLARSSYAETTFELGGLAGALALGRYTNPKAPTRLLVVSYLVGAAAVVVIPLVAGITLMLFTVSALAGVGALASQLCLNAITTERYPSWIRATGLGWALSVGRIGSIVSPLVAGYLLTQNWSAASILTAAAGPPLLCALLAFMLPSKAENVA